MLEGSDRPEVLCGWRGSRAAAAARNAAAEKVRICRDFERCGSCGSYRGMRHGLDHHHHLHTARLELAAVAAVLDGAAANPYAEPNMPCRSAARGLPQSAACCRNSTSPQSCRYPCWLRVTTCGDCASRTRTQGR